MSKVADAYVDVRAKTDGLGASMSQALSIVTGGMGKIAAIVGVGLGLKAGFDTLKESIHKALGGDAADFKLSKTVQATGNAAGWTSDQLEEMARWLGQISAFSRTAIVGAQGTLAAFNNIKGNQFKEALRAASDLASVMGMELPAAAKVVGDALDDPMKVAEGSLEQYGILLNRNEKAQIANAVAARDYAKAQDLILAQFGKFGGASEEFANKPAGAFKKWEAAVDNLYETLGRRFLPMLTEIVKELTGFADFVGAVISDLPGGFNVAWKAIKQTAWELDDFFSDLFKGIAAAAWAAFASMCEGAINAAKQIRNAFTGGTEDKGIWETMADSFDKHFHKTLASMSIGTSDATKRAKQEFEEAATAFAKKHGLFGRGKDGAPNIDRPGGKPTPYIDKKTPQFEFQGLAELSKHIQTQLFPSEEVNLQKAGVKFAEQAVNEQKQLNVAVNAVKDAIEANAKVAGAAVFAK